jgi:hypothetical protein
VEQRDPRDGNGAPRFARVADPLREGHSSGFHRYRLSGRWMRTGDTPTPWRGGLTGWDTRLNFRNSFPSACRVRRSWDSGGRWT